MMCSVLKCTEFFLCKRGKGVFTLGKVGINVSIQLSSQVVRAGDFGNYVCYQW